jgi:ABC-type multidrug transport system fused ATPase/permease subunit
VVAARAEAIASGAELHLGGVAGYFRIIRRIVPYALPLWDKLALRVAVAQTGAILSVFGFVAAQRAIDQGILKGDTGTFRLWASVAIGIAVYNLLLYWTYSVIAVYVGMRVNLTLKRTIFNHVLRQPMRFHQSRPIGENMYRINNDTLASVDFVANTLPEIVERFFAIATTVTLILTLNPFIFALIMVYIVLYLGYSQLVVGFMYRYQALFRAGQQTVMAIIQEILSAFPISKALSRQRHDMRRYFNRLAKQARAMFTYYVSESLWMEGQAVLYGAWTLQVAYYGICGYLTIKGEMTLGQFLAMPALILAVTVPLQTLVWSLQRLRVSAVAIQRVFQTLDITPDIQEPPEAHLLTDPRGEIEFQNVYFRYNPNGPDVIKNLSFKLEPGKKMAIVGVSGAGKSTIFNLLMRLYDPTEGRVLIDGHDLQALNLESYLGRTSVVLQDNFLFSASIRDNILMGKIDASEGELNEAIERAGLWPTVNALPEGLDTVLLEGGNLSMGQKQRMAIARAVIRDPKFLFLDEATSSLDPVTEKEILEQLSHIEVGRTRLVIAHHISSVQDADEILVMEHGVCVQCGRHDDLIDVDGPYLRLWAAEKEKHVEMLENTAEGVPEP